MALRDLSEVEYIPLLGLRPAEMRALETLPSQTKDALLPVIQLRPWLAAHSLSRGLERIEEAYGNRSLVALMGSAEPTDSRRPVHDELDDLRLADAGFQNWCEFIDENENFIPAVQFSVDTDEEQRQIETLHEFGRGLFVIIERPGFRFARAIARRVAELTDGGEDVCFILDYGRAGRDHLQVAAEATNLLQACADEAPDAILSLSATSFPDSFDGLVSQEIYERRLFNEVEPRIGSGVIYSDRGSARAEHPSGGAGPPPARIDYPLPDVWRFYRSSRSGAAGYQEQARLLIANPVWNADLRVWGTQMIERTAINDASAITSPQRATAARINIHLQRQTFYNRPDAALETDEDWTD